MMTKVSWIGNLLLVAGMTIAPMVSGEEMTRIGKQISDFALRDHYGNEHSLDDYKHASVIVVAFLGADCPLLKVYGPKLNELRVEYGKSGVQFLGVNSNRQDAPTKIGAWVRKYRIDFPILKDTTNEVADEFAAIRTPEVFVLDADRVVQYWGRIDDQYGYGTGVGYGKTKVSRHDLREAIDEVLAGKRVSVPVTEALGCIIGRIPEVEPHGEITYSKHVAPILQNHCVECHRDGEIGPFPLTNYEEVLGWGAMMTEVVDEGRMPPWYANPEHGEFENDARLTEEEKDIIRTWTANGAPEGDPANLPEPHQFAEGWSIPEPDLVLKMADKPFVVPADGVVDYQYFLVDPGFKEDKWIQASEARPGNRQVVHHIICFIQKPGAKGFGGEGALIGYAPGMQSRTYGDDVAIRVPAGSKFMFQMHYTPVGIQQEDISSLGIVFADPEKVTHELVGGMIGSISFRIPAGDSDHEVQARYKVRRDMTWRSMMPHMHVRGTSFRYEAKYPDGTNEILLDVPRYDFNWQLWYDFAAPKVLPKGTWVYCTAHYDNSEDNIYNPDPTIDVTWGEQTWEEMMFGFFSHIVPRRDLARADASSGGG